MSAGKGAFSAAAMCVLFVTSIALGAEEWRAKPAPDGAPVSPDRVRIVDYGDDLAWNYNEHQYRGGFGSEKVVPNLDLDGDGRQDDCIGYWPFSLQEPLNPIPPHWDTEAASSTFYGGFTGFFTNTQKSRFTEMCTNVDHPGDNINMMVTHYNEPYRCYGVWLWKKEDFLNGGDRHRVSFDEDSKIGLHIGRYWVSVDAGRYVVQDGDRFYISEFVFAGDAYEGRPRGSGITHLLRPTATRWAEYDPQPPYDITFDPADAEFAEHEFDDVRVVGYYAAKTEFTTGSTWLKQYAFEVYATVHRPERPSELLDMAAIPETELELAGGRKVRVAPFYVSTCQVPYVAWQKVWRWAVSPMFAFDWNYVFDRDGDMGNMDYELKPHGPEEPATDMTWLDAVAWCNALSELEGKEPVYYADAEMTTVFRKVRERWYDRETNAQYVPEVHVKWDADGYRLPTAAEWAAAGRDAVGSVWEWVWDGGVASAHTVLGGGLDHPEDPEAESASPYGDQPFSGSYKIGFRVVRGMGGRPDLQMEPEDVGVSAWTVREGEKTEGAEPEPVAEALVDLVAVPEGSFPRPDGMDIFVSAFQMARYETTYGLWKRVRDWAEAKGYTFNYDGDMGSMYHRTGEHRHSPDEPVTRITAFDCYAWCNALSEMEGRTPGYYTDEARTEVYRHSLQYREAMTFRGPWGAGVDGKTGDEIFVNWAADGYRLPTRAEWEYACRAGSNTLYFWGDEFDGRYTWYAGNSDGTTHPVGQKRPNAWGLHDMTGNVFDRCWGTGRSGYDPFELRNPKGEMGARSSNIVRGGSFRYPDEPAKYARYFQPAYPRPGCRQCFGYDEIGFRVVRCEEGTHPVDGVEETEMVFNDADTSRPLDPLEGATFRGSLARTGAYPGTAPRTLDGAAWEFETGGPVKSSPVVVDGIVYVGSDDGFLYALDAEDGAVVWKFETGAPVRSSVTVADGGVYFGSNNGLLYSLSAATGEENWRFTVQQCENVGGSPVVAYGCVFAYMRGWGYKTGLLAVDAGTGKKICRYPISMAPDLLHAFTPLDGELVCNGGGGADGMGAGSTAVNIRTARPRRLETDRVSGTPALRDATLYSAGMCVSAVDVATGKADWLTWLGGKGWKDPETYRNTTHAAPLVYGDAVYVGNQTAGFYAFDIETGERRWRTPVGGSVNSSAAGAGGVVCFGCDDGQVYGLDAASGRELWTFRTGGPVISSPCIDGGAVFIGSDDGFVYCLR